MSMLISITPWIVGAWSLCCLVCETPLHTSADNDLLGIQVSLAVNVRKSIFKYRFVSVAHSWISIHQRILSSTKTHSNKKDKMKIKKNMNGNWWPISLAIPMRGYRRSACLSACVCVSCPTQRRRNCISWALEVEWARPSDFSFAVRYTPILYIFVEFIIIQIAFACRANEWMWVILNTMRMKNKWQEGETEMARKFRKSCSCRLTYNKSVFTRKNCV